MLELLLERGELGEGRIGIRLFVAIVRAAIRLCVILVALGAVHTVAFVTARTIAAVGSRFAIDPLPLAFDALLAFMAGERPPTARASPGVAQAT